MAGTLLGGEREAVDSGVSVGITDSVPELVLSVLGDAFSSAVNPRLGLPFAARATLVREINTNTARSANTLTLRRATMSWHDGDFESVNNDVTVTVAAGTAVAEEGATGTFTICGANQRLKGLSHATDGRPREGLPGFTRAGNGPRSK